MLLREVARRTRQPTVGQRDLERSHANLAELDQDRRVAVEVRDREDPLGARGEHGFLLDQILNADGEDRLPGWRLIPEPLEVGLRVRSLPRERLPRDRPRPRPA